MSDDIWYHGSPLRLEMLALGSTVTRDRRYAEVFSHKPSLVVVDDAGQIRHDGRSSGLLYRVAESVFEKDFEPHPRSTMAAGVEWLTHRPLRLACLGVVEVSPEELLSEGEVSELVARLSRDRLQDNSGVNG